MKGGNNNSMNAKERMDRTYKSIKEAFELYNEICEYKLFTDFSSDVVTREEAEIALQDITGYFAIDVEAEFASILFDKISKNTGIPREEINKKLSEYFDARE